MAEETSTQYVAYTLYKADPAWLRLPAEERAAGKEAFADVVSAWQERMDVRGYSLVGVRPEVDFMLWKLTERYDDLRELATDLNATPLAGYLTTPYSYLAATKPSQYFEAKSKRPRRVVRADEVELDRDDVGVVHAQELDQAGQLLRGGPELLRMMGDARSELFHYEVRSTYDTPEVADSRRIVEDAQRQDSFLPDDPEDDEPWRRRRPE